MKISSITRHITGIMLMGSTFLTGCATHFNPVDSVSEAQQPQPNQWIANQHWLGADQRTDTRIDATGFLLFGNALEQRPEKAKQACEAMFTGGNSYDHPVVASDRETLVTYTLSSKHGDLTRASGYMKWSLCRQLNQYVDRHREARVLKGLGLSDVRGPLLVASDRAYKNGKQMLLVDLSSADQETIVKAIKLWKQTTSETGNGLAEGYNFTRLKVAMESLGQSQGQQVIVRKLDQFRNGIATAEHRFVAMR